MYTKNKILLEIRKFITINLCSLLVININN